MLRDPLVSTLRPEPAPKLLARLLLGDAESFFGCPQTAANLGDYLDGLGDLAMAATELVELCTELLAAELRTE